MDSMDPRARYSREILAGSLQHSDTKDEAIALWTYVRDHADIFRAWLLLPPDHPACITINERAAHHLLDKYRLQDSSNLTIELSIGHVIDAGIRLLTRYLQYMDEYSVDDIADMHHSIITLSIQHTDLVQRDDWTPPTPASTSQ